MMEKVGRDTRCEQYKEFSGKLFLARKSTGEQSMVTVLDMAYIPVNHN